MGVLVKFQENVFEIFTWTGVSRCRLISESNNEFSIYKTNGFRKFVYIMVHTNAAIKVSYLLLLLFGFLPHVVELEFMDKIGVLLWILIGGYILLIGSLFGRRHPFFELITTAWRIQNDIFMLLGQPRSLFSKINRTSKFQFVFLCVVSCIGTASIGLQYTQAPKYLIFTYSFFETDNVFLKLLFGLHETLYILHAWALYASVVYTSIIIGSGITYSLEFLSQVLMSLANEEENFEKLNSAHSIHDNLNHFSGKHVGSVDDRNNEPNNNKKKTRHNHNQVLSTEENHYYNNQYASMVNSRSVDEDSKQNLSANVHSRGNVFQILMEYRKIVIFMDRLNECISYRLLFLHAAVYIQLISDVYVMFQIFRSGEEIDIVTVAFYLEDCMVSMYVLFRMFKAMSTLLPAADSFIGSVKLYLKIQNLKTDVIKRVLSSLHIVSMMIGPSIVGPGIVGSAMMLLLDYYICVALW